VQVSNMLESIDLGAIALPEFQRGYVWTRKQVRAFMNSLYRKHPVGSLLVWVTQSDNDLARGDGQLQPGHVKLLLDGQQRITTLYGIIKGQPPKFFDGDPKAFTDLMFHLRDETFEFYGPVKMRDDPYWINVTDLMKNGLNTYIKHINQLDELKADMAEFIGRLNALTSIKERIFHIEEVAGDHIRLDDVVEIFNNVNSGGTKLSKGDLALAKVCAGWTDAREVMRNMVNIWAESGFYFKLDWLLRNVTSVITGQGYFHELEDVSPDEFREGLFVTQKTINRLLNMVSGRLGLDHDRVLGGRYAFPTMTRYLVEQGGRLNSAAERDKLLYWYVHSFLWGRYAGSTESVVNQDLRVIAEAAPGAELDALIDQLRIWRGDLVVRSENFAGWGRGARFYPFMYLLTRMGEAQDWGSGIPLRESLLGKLNRLQVHHIFPKALLYKHGYSMAQVNALANFCFLTQDTNLQISDMSPEVYFQRIAERYPGALESQWIPMDRYLWSVENYPNFLKVRQETLAEAANNFLQSLLATEAVEMEDVSEVLQYAAPEAVLGGIANDAEEQLLQETNDWVIRMGLSEGITGYELIGDNGELLAIVDLAWPDGLQIGLSQPAALLIDEADEIEELLNHAGFLYYTEPDEFRTYVKQQILGIGEVVGGD
jgi:hypothetical protein